MVRYLHSVVGVLGDTPIISGPTPRPVDGHGPHQEILDRAALRCLFARPLKVRDDRLQEIFALLQFSSMSISSFFFALQSLPRCRVAKPIDLGGDPGAAPAASHDASTGEVIGFHWRRTPIMCKGRRRA